MAVSIKPFEGYLVLDTENTTSNTGAPHDYRNVNCGVAWGIPSEDRWGFTKDPKLIQELVNNCTDLVGFNFKYDLAWLRNIGVTVERKRIWDTQIGYFLLHHQQRRYPSLDGCCEEFGLGKKIDVIATEYWDKGINTDAIPFEVLSEYAIQDVKLTWSLYTALVPLLESKRTLWMLEGYDIVILEEMERQGLKINTEYQRTTKEELQRNLNEVEAKIRTFVSHIPCFNPNSGDHLSALLYGGSITCEKRVPVGFYKTGAKTGQERFRVEDAVYPLKRMVKPLRGSELKKEGKYKVDEGTLKKLGDKTGLVDLLLEQSKLAKLIGTYFNYEDMMETMGWKDGCIHTQFSQVTTNTGRLSSTKPNIQNAPAIVDPSFVSRYD